MHFVPYCPEPPAGQNSHLYTVAFYASPHVLYEKSIVVFLTQGCSTVENVTDVTVTSRTVRLLSRFVVK